MRLEVKLQFQVELHLVYENTSKCQACFPEIFVSKLSEGSEMQVYVVIAYIWLFTIFTQKKGGRVKVLNLPRL